MPTIISRRVGVRDVLRQVIGQLLCQFVVAWVMVGNVDLIST
jgi:hypothetical protein